jgi:DNA-binding beta-propeller fold protein YncE
MPETEQIAETPVNSAPLDTGDVVFQFNAPSGETDGMAWDGTNLWLGCDGLDRIWKVDTLGTILDSIPAPTFTATGLTWDGQYLWCADGLTLRIYKMDPATGDLLDSIPHPGTFGSCEGLAWMNDTLWNTNWVDNIIWEIDPATGNVWGQFPAQGNGSTGLTWDWVDNALWNSDQNTDLIYKLDPATGTVITSFPAPDPIVQDLAFDGNYLWTCGWTTGIVYKLDIGYVGVEEDKVTSVGDDKMCATILSGPLLLPEGKKCKVLDIMGRVVQPDKITRGVYFIEIDGVLTQKVVKVR